MTKPILIKTIRRIILGLIGVAVLAGMFWYINTYIYQFYASTPRVGVDSSSTVAQVQNGSTFNVSTILSTQKVASADLIITFDKDKVAFQDTISSVPPNYFKVEYKKLSDGTTNQSKLRLILIGETTSLNSVQLNLGFKALKSGTATIAVTSDSVIAGVDGQNRAVIFDEDLTKASKTINITDPALPKGLVAHWRLDDNVTGKGQVIKDSEGRHDGTTQSNNQSGPNCTVAGKVSGSCLFDGTDDFIQVPGHSNFCSKDQTLMAWIKVRTYPTTQDSYIEILRREGNSGLHMSYYANQNVWDLGFKTDTGSVLRLNLPAAGVPVGTWNHLAVTHDGANVKAYINSVLSGTAAGSNARGTNCTSNNVFIGSYGTTTTGGRYFPGEIDDVRIYNYALNQEEISSIVGNTSNISPSPSPSPNVTISPTAGTTTTPAVTLTPTPPWQNTNYNTTTVYGIVQDVDQAGAEIEGKYWRKDATVCANAAYSNSAQMNINGHFLDKCQGFNNLPYFLTVVTNPGNNLAYTLNNIPEGYECVGWEHRLRIKSDGKSFRKTQGTGCATGPLEIIVNNAESSYDNSNFIFFKIRQVSVPTPTSPLEQFESVLNIKAKLQGIQTAPKEQYRKLNINVVLKGGGQTVKEQNIEFVAQQDGSWTGSMGVDGINAATKYEFILKGAKHLAKKICVSNPSEQLGGTYRCTDANITLQKGENNLDFSNIILLGGDLPAQDGLINALDFAFIRQNLGSQDPENLIRGDINLDGIIDTQDHTALKTALDFKYDEE